VRFRFRRRWMGPKHGVARGVAVFTSSTSDRANVVPGLLSDSSRLRQWSLAHGVVLTDDLASLEALDLHLDQWSADSSHHEHVDLGNEVGIYLGDVIVKDLVGASWKVWPNGHPVISLPSGFEVDVVAMVGKRLAGAGSNLPSIYATTLTR
jgi:hypothetical protein